MQKRNEHKDEHACRREMSMIKGRDEIERTHNYMDQCVDNNSMGKQARR